MRLLIPATTLLGLFAAAIGWEMGRPILYLVSAFGFLAVWSVYTLPRDAAFARTVAGYFLTAYVSCGALVLLRIAIATDVLPWLSVSANYVMTMALFACLARVAYLVAIARNVLAVADRYFRARDVAYALNFRGRRFGVEERTVATALMSLTLLLSQVNVAISVQVTYVNSALSTSLQAYDPVRFWHVILVDTPLVLFPWVSVFLASSIAARILSIRWRAWLTNDYEQKWLGAHRHYRMMLSGTGTDNPDQRIQEDVGLFINADAFGTGGGAGLGVYNLTMRLVSELSSLVAFSIILWSLSADLVVPGFLFWIALIYALAGTGVAALIGGSLVALSFAKQHYEADYRFGLSRLREYSEQIALQAGEFAERSSLRQKFTSIVRNFYKIMWVDARLSAFQGFFAEAGTFVPYILMGSLVLSRHRTLGDLTQAAMAFSYVKGALTFFVSYFGSLADFSSVQNRLVSFDAALAASSGERGSTTASLPPSRTFSMSHVAVDRPDGETLVSIDDMTFQAGENVIITGPSGSGKSTLLRVLSGIWPYWRGNIGTPPGSLVLTLPQKPYIPVGTLMAALSYPQVADHYDRDAVLEALQRVELQDLAATLDIDDNWTQRLSGGEQQRVAIARALLAKPAWLLLDEATSAMDPALEQRMYELLARALPETTLVSVAHRGTLYRFHQRVLQVHIRPDGTRVLEEARAGLLATN